MRFQKDWNFEEQFSRLLFECKPAAKKIFGENADVEISDRKQRELPKTTIDLLNTINRRPL